MNREIAQGVCFVWLLVAGMAFVVGLIASFPDAQHVTFDGAAKVFACSLLWPLWLLWFLCHGIGLWWTGS